MRIKINEMSRASEGDTIELEGKVFRLKEPNSNDFEGTIVWSQFIVLKDETGEQGCWLKLDSAEDKVSKGSSIKIKGKVGKDYKDNRGNTKRSINNCDFEVDKMQAPVQSSTQSSAGNGNGTKDNYWEKKFIWDQKVHFSIIRECAIKAVTELAKISGKTFLIKVHTEKDYFEFSDKIVDYICKKRTETKGERKEERIKKAREVVGDFATQPQKDKIYGIVICEKCGTRVYGFKCPKCKIADNIRIAKKGFIHSHLLTKDDFKNDMKPTMNPDKLTKIDAMIIWDWWLGNKDEEVIGERAKREKLETARGIVKNKGKLEVKSESEPYPDEVPDSWNEQITDEDLPV